MRNSLPSIFSQYPKLIITLSEKKDGPMKFSGDLLRDKIVTENRKKFLNKFGTDTDSIVSADLLHGRAVQIVNKKDRGKIIAKTDGLLTNQKNLFLTITVADCLPIFLYDFQKEIVGLIHAGWRSLAQNILASAIGELKRNFKSQPENILAGIGPGISQCHYQVGKEVLAEFKSLPSEIFLQKDEKIFLNLKKIAEIQLLDSGLKKENIEINPECTYCLQEKYFSYRRDSLSSDQYIEAMLAIIGIKK